MSYFIFDLDGTLALIDHRRPILDTKEPKRWDMFYEACDKDQPNWPVINLFQRFLKTDKVFIFSGRSESVKDKTYQWLMQYVIPGDWTINKANDFLDNRLMLRPLGNSEPDDVLKEKWLGNMFPLIIRHEIAGIFDDRQKVVDMWRRNGLPCFQVAPGDF